MNHFCFSLKETTQPNLWETFLIMMSHTHTQTYISYLITIYKYSHNLMLFVNKVNPLHHSKFTPTRGNIHIRFKIFSVQPRPRRIDLLKKLPQVNVIQEGTDWRTTHLTRNQIQNKIHSKNLISRLLRISQANAKWDILFSSCLLRLYLLPFLPSLLRLSTTQNDINKYTRYKRMTKEVLE